MINSGVPKVLMDIYDGLNDEYCFDFFVRCETESYYDNYLIQNGSQIIRFPGSKFRWHGVESFIYGFFVKPFYLWKTLSKKKYDIVHSCYGWASGMDCFIAYLKKVKIRVSNTHGAFIKAKGIIEKTYQKIQIFLLKNFSTERIAVSKYSGEELFGKNNYKIIYNSLNINLYKNIVKKSHGDIINIIQVGYFNENKNQLFSLHLIRSLLDDQMNVKLYLIGFHSDHNYYKRLMNTMEQLNIKENVILLPHDYNKFELYPIIDFCLIPSFSEGFSLVALECQFAGIYCLASLGVPEEANVGKLIRLSIDKPKEWVQKLQEPVDNQSIRKDLIEQFSRENFINQFRNIYS